ncbi:unnamed protein product [Urochloa decumbens]|uniref:F-box domain-containing protein n=1 Tax=Urochloa decumbens TaxID=240449 RepID=A0ABC9FXH0_9POAL
MPPQQGSRRRRAEDDDGGAEGVDRLSDLPEELRLHILGRLNSARDAARTSVLSRRWRGLWTGLPELTFRGVATGSVEAALAQITGPTALDLLDVRIREPAVTPGRVSSLLRAAARLGPKMLSIGGDDDDDPEKWSRPEAHSTFDLPCLERTTSLEISISKMSLAPPPAGEFAALTSLSIIWGRIDSRALLPLCPCLHVLVLDMCLWPGSDAIVHLPLLEELVLNAEFLDCIDIEAPVLKKVDVEVLVEDELRVSFFAPRVEQFDWCLRYEYNIDVAFGQLWRMDSVRGLHIQGQLPCLKIQLSADPDLIVEDWDFAEGVAQLRFPNFSALELDILTKGHVFGPMVLHLLQIRPVIRRLRISLEENDECTVNFPCSENCRCKQPNNWRSESVPLTNLEVVEIVDLGGKDHELDFLKLLLQCATVLKRMTVRLVDGVSSKEIRRIYKKYPNVECVEEEQNREVVKWGAN